MPSSSHPKVTLTAGLEFEPGASPFAGPAFSALGADLLAGSIRFSALKTLLPHIDLAVVPVVDHLSFAIALANVAASGAGLVRGLRVHLDWPEPMRRLLPTLASRFPESLLAAPAPIVADGVYRREGRSLGEAMRQSPLFLLHTSEPRRLFVSLFSPRHIHLMGGLSATLQWNFLTGHAPDTAAVPGELLLENGVLPWLSALFSQPHIQDDTVSTQDFLDGLALHPHEPHLLLASPETILGLARGLAHLESSPEATSELARRSEALQAQSVSRICPAATAPALALARPSRRALAELCPTLAFGESGLARAVEERRMISAWHVLFGEAFAQAFQRSAERYASWTRLEINRAQERDYFRFVHRLCREADRLSPTPFETLLAAQGTIDANFSYELLKECEDFPTGDEALSSALPEVEVRVSELAPSVSMFSIERFETLQRNRMSSLRAVKKKNDPKNRPEPSPVEESKYADGRWVNEDHPYSCSFPEEDVFMEDFAFHYRDQAKEMLRAKEQRSRELDTSLGDGLDLRSTVRHWHEERIFIFEECNVGQADVGAIVFQFVSPDEEPSFSWRSYWLAEKHDKGDLMFYATPFAENVIGPGIARSEFGGFAVIPLPNFLTDSPWNHPFIAQRPAPDALLVAAAAATDHHAVLYIAPEPPSREVSALLKRSGKSIITMKLDDLPADKIRRLRTFHILAEAGVRTYAHKFIRKD